MNLQYQALIHILKYIVTIILHNYLDEQLMIWRSAQASVWTQCAVRVGGNLANRSGVAVCSSAPADTTKVRHVCAIYDSFQARLRIIQIFDTGAFFFPALLSSSHVVCLTGCQNVAARSGIGICRIWLGKKECGRGGLPLCVWHLD